MGLPPRSCATDAYHCIMVQILPDLPNTSVERALACTHGELPSDRESGLTEQSPIQACPGEGRGQRAPASLRYLGNKASAAGASSISPGHVGLGPGLVDEDQVFGVEPALVFLPPLAPAGDVGAVLF